MSKFRLTADQMAALCKALEHIDKYPETYNFLSIQTPETLEEQACILGWTAYFSGYRGGVLSDFIPTGCHSKFYRVFGGGGEESDWWLKDATGPEVAARGRELIKNENLYT